MWHLTGKVRAHSIRCVRAAPGRAVLPCMRWRIKKIILLHRNSQAAQIEAPVCVLFMCNFILITLLFFFSVPAYTQVTKPWSEVIEKDNVFKAEPKVMPEAWCLPHCCSRSWAGWVTRNTWRSGRCIKPLEIQKGL